MIPTVTYSTTPGISARDKVFLISISEAKKYFVSSTARQCKPTEYAKAQGAYVDSSSGNCWWWLRSPGDDRLYASLVDEDGDVYDYGFYVSDDLEAVRPAMWIDLNA